MRGIEGMNTKQEQNRFNPFAQRAVKSTKIKKMIGVVSAKGGVGKSMVTGLLASGLSHLGYNVAILDADLTGPSIGQMYGITAKATGSEDGIYPYQTETGIKILTGNMLLPNNNDAAIWRGPMVANAVKEFYGKALWGEVDVMLIDLPPGTGDVPLTIYQSLPLDGIVLVTTPPSLVSMIVSKAISMANSMNIPILGILENMSWLECPDCKKKLYPFGESRLEDFAQEHQVDILGRLPINPQYREFADEGRMEEVSILTYDDILYQIEAKLGLNNESV